MNDLWRYETKIVVRDSTLSTILNEVYLNPLMFKPIYEPRQINNLYFDSLDHDHFHDHIYGYPQRTKVRLRWYGNFEQIKKGTLEIKKKDGSVGSKISFPALTDFRLDGPVSIFDVIKKTTAPPSWKETLSHLVPSLFNQYERSYFQSANGKVRLTIDSHIAHKSIFSTVWNKEPDDLRIIEFKYNQSEFFDGERALKNFSFVQDKSSKYVRGLLRIT
jgi:hypothetical protein